MILCVAQESMVLCIICNVSSASDALLQFCYYYVPFQESPLSPSVKGPFYGYSLGKEPSINVSLWKKIRHFACVIDFITFVSLHFRLPNATTYHSSTVNSFIYLPSMFLLLQYASLFSTEELHEHGISLCSRSLDVSKRNQPSLRSEIHLVLVF